MFKTGNISKTSGKHFHGLIKHTTTIRHSDEQVFVENSTYPRHRLKERLIKFMIIDHKCQCCSIEHEWNNKPLILQLDHINGINNDNRLENLRFLCPNCHSQQETFAGKNSKKN